ncbi:MAG: ribonuclease Z [Ignavibacteriae bacterium]|nr:ribonuclease Z [Ignavibacteriota bacterium]
MKLKFIGTGSGKTSLSRFHSSFLVSTNNKNILIDAGDGISKALLTQNISYNTIDSLILTHYHSDHLAGLPSLLTQMIIEKRTLPFNIYTHKKLVKALECFLHSSFLFPETFDFKVEIIGIDFEEKFIVNDNFSFIAKQNSHINNKHKLALDDIHFISSSFLINVENKKIFYTSDVGNADDFYLFQNEEVDLFITETTHITLEEIKNVIISQRYKSVILTHIDDDKTNLLSKFAKMLEISYNVDVILAEDGLTIGL